MTFLNLPIQLIAVSTAPYLKINYKIGALLSLIFLLGGCKLSVSIEGDGRGKVISHASVIDCSNETLNCVATFRPTSLVSLMAIPQEGSIFVGWKGACHPAETASSSLKNPNPTCTVLMNQDQVVRAQFQSEEILAQELDCGTEGAKAECLTPQQNDQYYIDQSVKYFLTMDSSVDISVQPNYSPLVARWEWAPWLLLTGFSRPNLVLTDILLKIFPTSYNSIDCRAFPTQPFGRCHVVFNYSGQLCPIYEEFTFNDKGEMTFIEAWSDLPGFMPTDDASDYWAEGADVNRLSTKIPGLGNTNGQIDLQDPWMSKAAKNNSDVANFLIRARQPLHYWLSDLKAEGFHLKESCEGKFH